MKARLSMSTRAFLCAFLPMCLVLAAAFFALSMLIRGRIKEGMRESLERAEKIQSSTRADYEQGYGQLLAFLGEDARLEAWVKLLQGSLFNPADRSRIHQVIRTQLLELGEMTDYDLVGISDPLGNPIAGCLREKTGGLVHLDPFPRTFALQAPFCANCHKTAVANLLNVRRTLYEIATIPISRGPQILGYLTVGKQMGVRSLSNFTYAALVQDNRILLTTFSPGRVEELEQQFRTRCAGELDGCEITVGHESYLTLAVDNARLPGLYSLQSVDAAMREFTRGFPWLFFLIGAGGILLVLPLSAVASRSFVKPITELIAHLKGSERRGEFRSDFATNSSVKEANLLAEAFNRAADAVHRSRQELQALTGRLIAAKEEESKRLARELHDVFSQRLAVLGMEVSSLQQQQLASLSLPLGDRIQWMGEEIGKLAKDVHELSRQLHPSILDDLGLTTALRAECANFSRQQGIPAKFLPDQVPESLPSAIALSLYRIAQESLWNVGKHAEARAVLVTLTGAGEEIVLAIHDDGNGFDRQQIKGKGGLGLVSMEERVRLVNGSFSVTSEPGKGTSVEVRVPWSGNGS
ncbi:MAG: sensor histidine kinase [Acidobacteria bacterium]|nr:sensor histidine kinase [Acidobacteriota bacterium]